jgi:hypothetical protein
MRKSLFFVVLLLILFVVLATKCYNEEDINNRILVTNTLEIPVYVVPSFKYPDTSMDFTNQAKIMANSNSLLVDANSSKRIGLLSLCYRNEWDRLLEPNSRLQLFVFDKKAIEELPWDSVKTYNLKLARYEMSYEELLNASCVIIIK